MPIKYRLYVLFLIKSAYVVYISSNKSFVSQFASEIDIIVTYSFFDWYQWNY